MCIYIYVYTHSGRHQYTFFVTGGGGACDRAASIAASRSSCSLRSSC